MYIMHIYIYSIYYTHFVHVHVAMLLPCHSMLLVDVEGWGKHLPCLAPKLSPPAAGDHSVAASPHESSEESPLGHRDHQEVARSLHCRSW